MSEDTREKVTRAVQKHGAAAVARAIGTSRNLILSYCAGTEHEASCLLVETRESRLDALDTPKAG